MYSTPILLAAFISAAAAISSKLDPTPQRWAWRTGTEQELREFAEKESFRISDIEIISVHPPLFAAIFVDNTGRRKKDWFLYTMLLGAELVQAISRDDSRVIDFDSTFKSGNSGQRILTAVAIRGEKVVWEFGTRTKPKAIFQTNRGKREVLDIDSYVENGKTLFTFISLLCPEKCTQRRKLLIRKSERRLRIIVKDTKLVITDIERHEDGSYSAILEQFSEPIEWVWLVGLTPKQIDTETMERSARVYDIEPHLQGSQVVYDVLLVRN